MTASIPESLKPHYAELQSMREGMELLRKNQMLRGEENWRKRLAERAATHNTWRQMKGVDHFFYEINHPGNKPFMIGLGITCTIFMYGYYKAVNSETAKKESKYWQRFHAKHDDH